MPNRREIDLPPDPREHRELWDHQAGEPPYAYHWFTHYLRLGPIDRSLARVVSDAYGANQGDTKKKPNLAQLKRYSSRYKWPDRAAAYDADLARKNRERLEDSQLAAAEAGATRLRAFMTAASQPIEGLLTTIRSPDYKAWYDDLDPGQKWVMAERMAKLLPGLLEAERIALGARLDAAAQLAASGRDEGAGESDGLMEMDSLERVAQVLSIMEEAGFRPRPKPHPGRGEA